MENKIRSMALPKIKRLMRLRLISLLLSVLFTAMAAAFLFGIQVMHWVWSGSRLTAASCAALAVASCAGYLFLNKKLVSGGL